MTPCACLPPTISTLKSGSTVAVCPARAVVISRPEVRLPTGRPGRARPVVCDGATQTARKHARKAPATTCVFDRNRLVYGSLEDRFNRFAALPPALQIE